MSLIDRIAACRTWEPAAYRPFLVDGRRLGRVPHDLAARLADFPDVFEVRDDAVALAPGLEGFEARGRALDVVVRALADSGHLRPLRGEPYGVVGAWGEQPAFTIDRTAVPRFGLKSFGVHVNGYVRKAEGLHLWVGKRARDKPTGPGKLDHIVAGGQGHGLGLMENVVKEAAEEAAIPADLARRAVPVGALSYICEQPDGLRDDILFCYDLELPAKFTPENTDGEIEWFELWPAGRVLATVRAEPAFKFNVALVTIDFFLRHGLIDPDTEPDYMAVLDGVRAPAEAYPALPRGDEPPAW